LRLLASNGAGDEAVHARHARLLVASGNVAEARAILEAVLKLAPGSPEALAVLAEIAAATDDDDLARRVRAAAMKFADPGLPLGSTQPEARA
jgi:Tfp pilus assembly protein PilF